MHFNMEYYCGAPSPNKTPRWVTADNDSQWAVAGGSGGVRRGCETEKRRREREREKGDKEREREERERERERGKLTVTYC